MLTKVVSLGPAQLMENKSLSANGLNTQLTETSPINSNIVLFRLKKPMFLQS